MPPFQKALLFRKILFSTIAFIASACLRYIRALAHKYTYRPTNDPKNVVIVGASFAGWYLARELARSLPTGYRVVLVERNSHFHYTWLFPRISVIPNHEDKAFIPYASLPSLAPKGSFVFKHATVERVDASTVKLTNGETIEYSFLAIATGSSPRYPIEVSQGCTKNHGVKFFRSRQEKIAQADNIVIIGGGAVGVEIALDIKSRYPGKDVCLVHSRDRLLHGFKSSLSQATMSALEAHGVAVHLGHRVLAHEVSDCLPLKGIRLNSDETLSCDLLLRCTGQIAASTIMTSNFESCISQSGFIRVKSTLQLDDDDHPNIFALGDVADTTAPKMGRAAFSQALVVAANITNLISGRALREYKPSFVEASTELTLGVQKSALYIDVGTDGMIFSKKGDETMHAAQAWKGFDAVPFIDGDYDDADGAVKKLLQD